jgi:hypothetical protein
VKQISPTDLFWHQVDSDKCNFHPLIPALTLVSLLERYLWFETATPRGDFRNWLQDIFKALGARGGGPFLQTYVPSLKSE